jgi:hypothetical protein
MGRSIVRCCPGPPSAAFSAPAAWGGRERPADGSFERAARDDGISVFVFGCGVASID